MAMRVRLVAIVVALAAGLGVGAGGCGNASRSFGDVIMTVTVPDGVAGSVRGIHARRQGQRSFTGRHGRFATRAAVRRAHHARAGERPVRRDRAGRVCRRSDDLCGLGVRQGDERRDESGSSRAEVRGTRPRQHRRQLSRHPAGELPGFAALGVRRRLTSSDRPPPPAPTRAADLHLVRAVGHLR